MGARLAPFVALVALLGFSTGCTHVRASRRNPQTGETWTVYSHTFEDDTVSYCAAPQWGGGCFQARRVSRPPEVMPSQAYAQPQLPPPAPFPGAPFPPPWPPPPNPWPPPPNGWGR